CDQRFETVRDRSTASEVEYRTHLPYSCAPCAQEPAKEGVIQARSQTCKIRMIQAVEEIRTDFQSHAPADRQRKALCQTEVKIRETLLANRATAYVTGPYGGAGRAGDRNEPENRWIQILQCLPRVL